MPIIAFRRICIALSLALAAGAAHGAPEPSTDDALWQKLAIEPGLVVFMRHTQPAGGDALLWDTTGMCQGEAMLTAEGEAHAKRIGETFAARGVRPTVISSPMCRCRDTARIAFGSAPITDPELREVASADSQRLKAFEAKAREMLARHRGPAPVVVVNHRPNIDRLTMELLGPDELIVGRVSASGEVDVLGKIRIP